MLRSSSVKCFDDLHRGLHKNNQSKTSNSLNRTFALCCRKEDPSDISKGELLLMWDMYTNKSDLAVKIAFNKDNLIQYFESIFKAGNMKLSYNEVEYSNTDQRVEKRFFRKDINYSFELKYRFIIERVDDSKNLFAPYCKREFTFMPLDIKKFGWADQKCVNLFESIKDQQLQYAVSSYDYD